MAISATRVVSAYLANEGNMFISNTWARPDASRPGVIWAHGAGSDATQGYLPPYAEQPQIKLAEAGFNVLCIDAGGTNTFGNDTSLAAVTAAKTWMQGAGWAAPGKVVLGGASMGAQTMLNWARANPTLVSCVYGTIPLVSMIDLHDNNRGGYAASVEAAYGGAVAYAAAAASHDPLTNAASYAGLPIHLSYSTNDTVVIPSTVTSFAAASGATAVPIGAVGHNPLTADADAIRRFVTAHA